MGEFFVYSFFAGAVLLLFPVFLYADIYADLTENRAWFCISLFHKIKLFGGYAQVKAEGFVFHLTKRKAVLLPFSELSAARKRFEITKGFQLWRFHQIVETDGANQPKGVMIAALLCLATGTAFSVLHEKHAFLSLKSRALLHNEPCLKISLRAAMVMNGLVLAIALAKKLLEGVIEWTKKRKSTASWRKLRKNLRASSTSAQ